MHTSPLLIKVLQCKQGLVQMIQAKLAVVWTEPGLPAEPGQAKQAMPQTPFLQQQIWLQCQFFRQLHTELNKLQQCFGRISRRWPTTEWLAELAT